MKKLHKLAAAVAVAAGIALSPQAGAIGYNTVGMEQETGGRGDTLLFPVFYGYGENIFTISNTTDQFIQGHLRFRGAAWSGELLDFDVILTPGDVFVFRLADIDGDGFWEIDQSLDPSNFAYTGMLQSCSPEGGKGVAKNNCMDQFTDLIPASVPECGITPETITHHRNVGYVEFIGEGVLNGLTHDLLNSFINPLNAGRFAVQGQREIDNRLGTSLWSWVMPDGQNNDWGLGGTSGNPGTFHARTALDVPNALSGTAFITTTGKPYGVAYNAEALVNFRTNGFPHRADNYNVTVNGTPQTGVILHNENAAAPAGNFLYRYGYLESGLSGLDQNTFESRISFSNTWGPTLADGDDYGSATPSGKASENLANLRYMAGNADTFDLSFAQSGNGFANSLAEVEEAIRKSSYYGAAVTPTTGANPSSPRQLFTGFYFDNALFDKASNQTGTACQNQSNGREPSVACGTNRLQSWYFAFFPTKFFYAEDSGHWRGTNPTICGINNTDKLLGRRGYLEAAVVHALAVPKPFDVQVWDITEKTPGKVCIQSPCLFETRGLVLTHELAVFNIKTLKDLFGAGEHQNWDAGRIVLQVQPESNVCRNAPAQHPSCISTFPGLLYTFEMGTDGSLGHWRSLER